MSHHIDLSVSITEGLRYVPFVVSGSVVLRIAKFPDFGFAGAFLLGTCVIRLTQLAGESHSHAVLVANSILFAALAGAACGLLTSLLFLFLRLNSLISGIVTMLVSYSIAVVLTRMPPSGQLGVRVPTIWLGMFGGGIAVGVVALFCSSSFLRLRILCAKPSLHRQLDKSPSVAILSIMALGNGLAGISGYLCAHSLGECSIDMADDKMFLALTSLILGESVLALILKLSGRLVRRAESGGLHIFTALPSMFFSVGANTPFLMASAVIGPILYFIIFSGATSILQISTDWNKLFLGSSIVVVLLLAERFPTFGIPLEEWAFQEKRSW